MIWVVNPVRRLNSIALETLDLALLTGVIKKRQSYHQHVEGLSTGVYISCKTQMVVYAVVQLSDYLKVL
jgi:hypothetical protein